MIDVSQLQQFARSIDAAVADLPQYTQRFLEDEGEEFLKLVQTAIEDAGNIDTGKLKGSFQKGGAGNIWILDAGGLTLTIGTNVEYAAWVNDGHRQKPGRFVPGYWEGSHFRYMPGAKTGMVLKASFVQGSHYFDKAVQAIERMFPEDAQRSFKQFFDRYF